MTLLFRILTAAVMVAALSACGGGGSDPSTPNNSNNTSGTNPNNGTTPSTGTGTPTTPGDTTPSTGTTTPTTPDQTTPTTGNASGQPWGSVVISGSAAPQNGLGTLAPNGVPKMQSGNPGSLTEVLWVFDDDYTARSTTHAPNRKTFDLRAGMPAAAGRYIGVVNVAGGQFNSQGNGTSNSLATMYCGGGSFTFDPRDAECDKITVDLAARTLTLNNVSFITDSGSTTRSATFQVSGTLKWPDVRAKAGTTVTKAQLLACPLVAAGFAFNPAWSTASCTDGTYVGTSETGAACTVTIDSASSKASFSADSYTANYTNLLQQTSVNLGPNAKITGYRFSSTSSVFGDGMTIHVSGGVSGIGINTYSPTSNTPLAVRFDVSSNDVSFVGGVAVINSPLRAKFCDLALD